MFEHQFKDSDEEPDKEVEIKPTEEKGNRRRQKNAGSLGSLDKIDMEKYERSGRRNAYKGTFNLSAATAMGRKFFVQENKNNQGLKIIEEVRKNFQKKLNRAKGALPLKSVLK
eukprot:CAMPEP_0114576898 /NCGR_PEP_ID=MMETSP0125-20121206/1607_1 /TAXON_ID=485358 ORGANISM="Aristerostoma sp., Strain ATCC 50986" /NCGR_SAMPLE_ID=MMETSP0125 /ASSEMBLY_ACC=CAM_ASM_000245 /LENGTH=112 /DNA_ID=CAMNT_0001765767 /DNA_START=3094 /DNA_END=3432 /DNA_ORIENTATION=+